jgi:hypothetical protein
MKASLALGLMIALLSIVAAPQLTEAGFGDELLLIKSGSFAIGSL